MKNFFTILFTLFAWSGFSQTIVISQVYGAGGNTGAPLNADYVELHNVSTVSQSLSGLSIQYSGATSTTAWTGVASLPAATIPAGGYYLIQMSTIGTNGSPLPTVNYVATPSISMSATAGKVALVTGSTALSACPFATTPASIIDYVGYGGANCSEGNNPTGVLSATTAAIRKNNGCTDTDNNGNDFDVAAPAPRNGASSVVICGGGSSPVLTAGTVSDFGNVIVLTNSASQSFNLSGTNLTGFPGSITVTAPSTDFQVSNNNTTWGATTTITYSTATLSATPLYVRFAPQTIGLKTGNISITGGGAASAVLVAVRGTGIAAPTPTLSATTLTTFGSVCVNSTGGPNSFNISGTNLTAAAITVGPLSGYSFATSGGGPFTSSITLNQPGGSFASTVFVVFTPTAVQTYNSTIPVSGGGAPAITVAVTGSGVNSPATVTTGSASAITFNSATLSATIPTTGCSAISAYGFAYSTVSGFTTGTTINGTNLSGGAYSVNVSGLAPSTVYYYKSFATNSAGTVFGIERSFRTSDLVLTATALQDFGTNCLFTASAAQTFTLSSSFLTGANIIVGPLSGYSFSTSAAGTYAATLTITQPGGVFNQVVYVKFTPAITGSYNGNIPISGGGAASITVAATGVGVNTAASVETAPVDPLSLSSRTEKIYGIVTDEGCSDVLEYGFIYSGISGFPLSMGTKVIASDINATGNFSTILSELAPNTTYFYKAYAVNAGGITYGIERSFTTTALLPGLVIYNVPVQKGGMLHFSATITKPGHYGVRIVNSAGQYVYRKDFIVQTSFMDEYIQLPAGLSSGVYSFQLESYLDLRVRKSFIIQ